MERYKVPVAVHLFLIQENSMLMLRRYQTGYEDGNYSVVAGHVEENENVIQAMQREAKEEAGITIKQEDLTIVQVMHRKRDQEARIDYFLYCDTYEGDIQNAEPNKCDQMQFFDLDCLPKNTIDYVREAIENYKNNIVFSLFGWKE